MPGQICAAIVNDPEQFRPGARAGGNPLFLERPRHANEAEGGACRAHSESRPVRRRPVGREDSENGSRPASVIGRRIDPGLAALSAPGLRRRPATYILAGAVESIRTGQDYLFVRTPSSATLSMPAAVDACAQGAPPARGRLVQRSQHQAEGRAPRAPGGAAEARRPSWRRRGDRESPAVDALALVERRSSLSHTDPDIVALRLLPARRGTLRPHGGGRRVFPWPPRKRRRR